MLISELLRGGGAVHLFDTPVEVFLQHGGKFRPGRDHVRRGVAC